MAQIRTDLAMESFQAAGGGGMPGVDVSSWEQSGVTVTEVKIETESAAERLGKQPGRYITLECEGVKERDPAARESICNLLAEEIGRLLPADEQNAPVMVVGLGNRSVTPDSLGPRAVDGTLVTRHIFKELPEAVDERLSPVCAFAPGVLGVTGVETLEAVGAITREVKPRCVIIIDSLAARAAKRIGVTVQLSDTGIQPGSGVGNLRRALNQGALGVKVIAIGVPTVVYASTIARDALEFMSEGEVEQATLDDMMQKLLSNEIGEMIVTPREIDQLISDAAIILAGGINRALQPELSPDEIQGMLDI